MLTLICLGLLSNLFVTHPTLSEDVIWERSYDCDVAEFIFIDEEAGSRPPEMDIDVDDVREYTEI